ncbi:pyridoxal-phosphate-dependent aminotransferase family protein [Gloeobacter kilaueensis]|uniref:Tritium exchange subunit n=1 Tax=Gloeobacter kilaueensis (strain ATCC BAA-2537 / CCAP 1431/1 / ULC 316 / JS1) TaxID=1183438 RepID=U5QIB9_GLOK1|nr:alanine--glyoxylate aminotransferase family protein [Gloeobacter kilaueensis]AGY58737.1 aminotransferase class V [Gloeobacter kilaueensis JS1]
MDDKLFLMIPGPTPIPERALLAMAKAPVGHRSSEFARIMAEVSDNLRWLHQTRSDVLILASSGTGALEAAIVNACSPGDRVLVGANGKFGERWVEVARAFGLKPEVISAPYGQPLPTDAFQAALAADTDKAIKAVIVTHSETSTGVLNDLGTIAGYIRAHGEAVSIVDAVTSLGAANVPVDEWGLDFVGSGSQKAYMIPPGLAFLAVSERGWQAVERSRSPRYYFDLRGYRKALKKNNTPFTTPVNLVYALQVTLQMLKAEGLEGLFARHTRLRDGTRAAIRALGLGLFAPDDTFASTAITAVIPPPDIPCDKLRATLKKNYDIVIAGGQGEMEGQIVRLGHLGFVSERDVLTAIAALEGALHTLGYDGFTPGSGVAAASAVLFG